MRADDVAHVDHVDREAVQFGRWLAGAAVADAAAFARAQPAVGHAFDAGGAHAAIQWRPSAMLGIQLRGERRIESPAGDDTGEFLHQRIKGRGIHVLPPGS